MPAAPVLSIVTEPKVPRTAYLIDVNSDISPIDNIEFNEKDSITLLIDENSENLPIKLYKKAKSAGLDQSMQCLSMPTEKSKANEKLAFLLGIMCAEKDNVVLLSDNDTDQLKEVAAEFGKSFTTLKSEKRKEESKPNLQIIASKKNIEQITPSAKQESVKKAGSDVRAKLSDILGADDPQHQYANAISALFRADKNEATLKHDFVAILGPTKGLIYADKILAIFKEWKEA